MKGSSAGGVLIKIGLVLISIFIAVGAVFSADSSVKSAKQTSAQQAAKTDPNDWKKGIDAAKKEGKVVVSGSPGEGWRKALADAFQQEYPGIAVEFTGEAPRNFWPRTRRERELGKKLWDIIVGGMDSQLIEAKKDGLLAPIRPLLLPEIADDSKWVGGMDYIWNDREKKYLLASTLYMQPSVYVNRDFIKESDLRSTEQLLDPKFRGKIVILTPTGGASRKALCHMAFTHGDNFLRDLLSKQDVVITDDNRQQVEWMVRGKYPIAIGFSLTLLIPFEKQGLGKNILPLEEKIIRTTAGSGVICMLEGPPHPNAAKVYVNWFLSQKAQIMLTKNIEHNSRRIDVPPVEDAVDPAKLSKYRDSSTEEGVEYEYRYDPLIKEALRK